ESVRFTRERSLVRSQYPPPSSASRLQTGLREYPSPMAFSFVRNRAKKKSGHPWMTAPNQINGQTESAAGRACAVNKRQRLRQMSVATVDVVIIGDIASQIWPGREIAHVDRDPGGNVLPVITAAGDVLTHL